jgi:hypothetical protein
MEKKHSKNTASRRPITKERDTNLSKTRLGKAELRRIERSVKRDILRILRRSMKSMIEKMDDQDESMTDDSNEEEGEDQ